MPEQPQADGPGCHNAENAQGRLPPLAGTYGGAYYGPLLYHLLPYIEQKAMWDSASTLDTSAQPPTTTVNASSVVEYRHQVAGLGIGKRESVPADDRKVPTYQCPTDPTIGAMHQFAPGNAGDWGDGDCSYAANYMAFAPYRLTGSAFTFPSLGTDGPDKCWDAKATLSSWFSDGTSNTVLFAEKYARCDMGGESGNWWLRGVTRAANPFDKFASAQQDSYPGDGFSSVFGGGRDIGGNIFWLSGSLSMFQIKPLNPTLTTGKCDPRLASTSHNSMQVALADGSVRSISDSIKIATWAAVQTPHDGEKLGPDWQQ